MLNSTTVSLKDRRKQKLEGLGHTIKRLGSLNLAERNAGERS